MICFVQRVGLVLALVTAGCAAATPEPPASLSFRPTYSGAKLWLATPFAVEVKNERDARELEAMDAIYVGELGVSKGRLQASSVAAVAAERGATHYRVVTTAPRVDVVLYRVEPDRWARLPPQLQPLAAYSAL